MHIDQDNDGNKKMAKKEKEISHKFLLISPIIEEKKCF